MSVFRTIYPRDTVTVLIPDADPVVIGYGGAHVPDEHDHLVLAAAAAYRVPIVQGGAVVVPGTGSLDRRVGDLETALRAAVVPLTEQPARTTAGPLLRSGQLVPYTTGTGSTTPVTVTLEPGGTGSRVGVRLDSGTRPLVLAGSGDDVVPAATLTDPGTVLVLEGIVGGGGWRIITAYAPPRPPYWSEILDRPTIPTRYDQLSGSVPVQAIPNPIVRDTQLEQARATLAAADTALSGQISTLTGRVSTVEARPFARYYCDVASPGQFLTNDGTLQNVPFNIALTTHAAVTRNGNTTFTLNRAGVWTISAGIRIRSGPATARQIVIYDGTLSTGRWIEQHQPTNITLPAGMSTTVTRRFPAGQVVALGYAQTAGTGEVRIAFDAPESTSISFMFERD